jgi:hypothetical protein
LIILYGGEIVRGEREKEEWIYESYTHQGMLILHLRSFQLRFHRRLILSIYSYREVIISYQRILVSNTKKNSRHSFTIMMTNEYKSCSQDTIYSAARPPITAAPIIPQAAVSRGTAAPLEVEVDAALVAELVEEAEEVVEVLEELEPL